MRDNSAIIGPKQTVSLQGASGMFTLIEQQINQGANVWPLAGGDFSISPAVDGKPNWDFNAYGDLNLGTDGEWTITVITSFSAVVKMWGAGGARGYNYSQTPSSTSNQGPGGGGGYSSALINFTAGQSFILRVGQGGARSTVSSTGATYLAGGVGRTSSFGGTEGGGYTGVFLSSVTQNDSWLIAGGGGGGADSSVGAAGAGGGSSGGNSTAGSGQGGNGGSQVAGGTASQYNGATAGAALIGGVAMKDSATNAGLGGGGGGYFGGGGGNVGGGGGGSGRIGNVAAVTGGVTTSGTGDTPGNSSDADRSGAGAGGSATQGNTGADGRLLLAKPVVASLLFDGTGDYITINGGTPLSLTGDFTVEFFVRFASLASYSTPFTLASGSGGGENYIQSTTSGGTSFTWGGWGGTNLSAGTGFAINTWYHLAICRSGSTIRSFKDGVLVANGTSSSTIPSSGGYVYIGSQNSTQWFFNGNISNIRVVKGTALYTSNFTPPQSTLSAISGTSLLVGINQLYANDFSTNRQVLTFNGNTTYSTSIVPF